MNMYSTVLKAATDDNALFTGCKRNKKELELYLKNYKSYKQITQQMFEKRRLIFLIVSGISSIHF